MPSPTTEEKVSYLRVNQRPVGNSFLDNAIYANGGLGDQVDPDVLEDFPILTTVSTSGESTTVEGYIGSPSGTDYTIEFFANLVCDPTGYGEGRILLGEASATGNEDFSISLPALPEGMSVTATATDLMAARPNFLSVLHLESPEHLALSW